MNYFCTASVKYAISIQPSILVHAAIPKHVMQSPASQRLESNLLIGSLPCCRRHKIRNSCNGVRDPTVFKPKSELATPSGIDHDYNFIHSIEYAKERSEKIIVVDRGLVDSEELELARRGEDELSRVKKSGPDKGKVKLNESLKKMGTTVVRAPKGMRRNMENETCWSRKLRCVRWQVEWMREDAPRVMGLATGTRPIGDIYAAIMEEERKAAMTDLERRAEKKRRSVAELEKRDEKKRKAEDNTATDVEAPLESTSIEEPPEPFSMTAELYHPILPATHKLYLHRPHTPSSMPKVLVPLDPSQPLDVLLQHRTVLEYPTIYVFENDELPGNFMLENDYLDKTGEAPSQGSDSSEEVSTDNEEVDDDTSSSGSDSEEEEAEESEVVPTTYYG